MAWTRGNPIGHGSSATVSVATNDHSGEVFAVKSVELSRSGILQREQKILSSINSPHVVSYMGCDISDENGQLMYNLFMEYIAGGSLSGLIQNQGGRIEEDSIQSITREILLGLEYLHGNGLVHCDIKGHNILISPQGSAKIADLGCARRVDETIGSDMPIAGTPVYMAPEVARGEAQGLPSDVWALGCTIIEMATGRPPWPEVKNNVSALYRIGFSDQVPEFPSFLSEEAKDFLEKCFRRDPKERWTTKQLLGHAYIDQFSSCSNKIQVSSSNNSPTSILDQDFWDSIEVSDESRCMTQFGCSNSAVERLRKMASPSGPNWESEENWITLRTNEENENCVEEVFDEQATISGVDSVEISHEEEMEICGSSVSPVSEISISGNSKSRSSNLGRKRGFGEVCKCVDSNLNFETQRGFMFSFNTNSFRP